MRMIGALCCGVLALCVPAHAHDRAGGAEEDPYSIGLIRESVKNPGLALGFSVTEKRINRLGDRAAIAVIKLYDADALATPDNIRKYLPLVRAAFAAPGIVEPVEDRKPKVTVFLLTYLEMATVDADLKAQISGAIQYVRERTSKE